jgi:hypothetical protein
MINYKDIPADPVFTVKKYSTSIEVYVNGYLLAEVSPLYVSKEALLQIGELGMEDNEDD